MPLSALSAAETQKMLRLLLVLAISLYASALSIGPTVPLRVASACRIRVAPIHAAEEDETPDPQVVIKDAVQKMKKSVASVQESLSTLRVGRASPSLLDRVEVDYYGAPTPLNQLASVTAPTATQLLVDPYDKSAIGDVEKALSLSDLGMTPNSDGKVIRLNVPQLTEER